MIDHTVKWTLKSSKIRLRSSNTVYLRVYILREGSSHYYSTMFHNILVLVRRIEKVTESNRKYERVTVKTDKAEYGHVLTHAPSQRIHEIHNSNQGLISSSPCFR